MGCGAVDEAAPPLTRGRGYDAGYGENSVRSATTLMGPATPNPDYSGLQCWHWTLDEKPKKKIVSGGYFIEQNFTELKLELVIQSGLGRHKKTKLIKIGKELECESLELGLSKLRKIHSSCGGFLLMSEPGDCGKLQLINPATKFCLTIPRCPSLCPHKACSAALAFDSWTKQYKVVHVVTDSYGFEIFNLCGGDDEHWERVPGPWEDQNDRPFDPLTFSGRIQCQ
ncbi:hypothetical protein CQW23_21635 [Capsicum baccatum]|uniref:Uncharacterized protein n=1 Tax=Capsicum baccatum TaxID=33114 RepID=A0A2G2VYK9_CAPBA|nr:hypothetical protein CQW23_21635 [Capsicum baccatum]